MVIAPLSFFLSLFQMAMHGELKHWPNWIETLVHINHFALVVNSSINILIYACKDEKFLNVLLGRAPPSVRPSVRPSVFSIPFLLSHSQCQPATGLKCEKISNITWPTGPTERNGRLLSDHDQVQTAHARIGDDGGHEGRRQQQHRCRRQQRTRPQRSKLSRMSCEFSLPLSSSRDEKTT